MLPGTYGKSAALSTVAPGAQGTSLPTHDARACRFARRTDKPGHWFQLLMTITFQLLMSVTNDYFCQFLMVTFVSHL